MAVEHFGETSCNRGLAHALPTMLEVAPHHCSHVWADDQKVCGATGSCAKVMLPLRPQQAVLAAESMQR